MSAIQHKICKLIEYWFDYPKLLLNPQRLLWNRNTRGGKQ